MGRELALRDPCALGLLSERSRLVEGGALLFAVRAQFEVVTVDALDAVQQQRQSGLRDEDGRGNDESDLERAGIADSANVDVPAELVDRHAKRLSASARRASL